MKTIILNGSPKGNSRSCNSQIFAGEFVRNMQNPCEIRSIAQADPEALARYAEGFDAIIVILPLYIHAMPGITMRFFESLQPAAAPGQSIGFIIQAGFMETAQERFVEAYFRDLARQLNRQYLGTVSKGEAAGTYMYPKMFRKVFRMLNDLGKAYEEMQAFDPAIVKQLGHPYELSKSTLRLLKVVSRLGLADVGWNQQLRKNQAYERRLDRPFL